MNFLFFKKKDKNDIFPYDPKPITPGIYNFNIKVKCRKCGENSYVWNVKRNFFIKKGHIIRRYCKICKNNFSQNVVVCVYDATAIQTLKLKCTVCNEIFTVNLQLTHRDKLRNIGDIIKTKCLENCEPISQKCVIVDIEPYHETSYTITKDRRKEEAKKEEDKEEEKEEKEDKDEEIKRLKEEIKRLKTRIVMMNKLTSI